MIDNPIATKKRTRQIQDEYGACTRKILGQNFIIEPGVVEKISKAASGDGKGLMIEIGPGIGALTQFLCEDNEQVLAYEIDERFPEILEKEIGSDHLTIVLKNFLDADLKSDLKEYIDKNEPIRVAGNLPYYITSAVLMKLFESGVPFESITVMMQKEAAERFLVKPGSKEYNAFQVIASYCADIKKIMDVNRNVFWPSPNVGSVVLRFEMKKNRSVQDEQAFFDLIRASFVQPRKTLYNNLREHYQDGARAAAVIEKAGLNEGVRAQQMDLESFIRLFEAANES